MHKNKQPSGQKRELHLISITQPQSKQSAEYSQKLHELAVWVDYLIADVLRR